MVKTEEEGGYENIWFLDSGCSNHMTSKKSLFKSLNENHKINVRFGDDKLMQVSGKGTVAIKCNGTTKLLHDVYYVPTLSQNLLSIGQLMDIGYSIIFDDCMCVIKEKQSG